MINKNHKNKNDKSNMDNFIDKIFKLIDTYFNFVENSWWNKKNHQYDNLKNNFV